MPMKFARFDLTIKVCANVSLPGLCRCVGGTLHRVAYVIHNIDYVAFYHV